MHSWLGAAHIHCRKSGAGGVVVFVAPDGLALQRNNLLRTLLFHLRPVSLPFVATAADSLQGGCDPLQCNETTRTQMGVTDSFFC
jgi:hypothetical protein